MAKKIGTNLNTSELSVDSTINTNSNTAVKIADATNPEKNPIIKMTVFNNSRRILWVRNRPAAEDDIKDGVAIPPLSPMVILDGSSIYTGEISAIIQSGSPSTVMVSVI